MNKKEVYLVVYDTLDNDCVVFYGTYKEVGAYFNTKESVIRSFVCRKNLRQNRYRIEKIKVCELEDELQK